MSFHPQTPQSPGTSVDSFVNSSSGVHTSSNMSASTLPTPAHSVNGTSQQDVTMTDDSPHKRKRTADDGSDGHDSKKVLLEGQPLTIDELHRDVGPKYLLCQNRKDPLLPSSSKPAQQQQQQQLSAHVAPWPSPASDLYSMFNLTGLAAEVARKKPNGEKNSLRSSYKGHLKQLGVAGHWSVDAKKAEDQMSSEFLNMLQVPDLEWTVHQVQGKEIRDGLSADTLNNLTKAMSMAKGPIEKGVWDTTVLGELGGAKPKLGKLTTPNTPNPTAATGRPSPLNPAVSKPVSASGGAGGQDPARPKRNIKKRGYGDDSYEGYSESFADGDGYDTGDGENGGKRRKKNSDSTSPYPGQMRQQSYGPGMVGA